MLAAKRLQQTQGVDPIQGISWASKSLLYHALEFVWTAGTKQKTKEHAQLKAIQTFTCTYVLSKYIMEKSSTMHPNPKPRA